MENKRGLIAVVLILMVAIVGTIGLSVVLMIETYRGMSDEFSGSVQSVLDDAIRLERKVREARMVNVAFSMADSTMDGMGISVIKEISPNDISSVSVFKDKKENDRLTTMRIEMNTDSISYSNSFGKFNVKVLRGFIDEFFRSGRLKGTYSLLVTREMPGKNVVVIGNEGVGKDASIRISGIKGDTTLIRYGGYVETEDPVRVVVDTLYDDRINVHDAIEVRSGFEAGSKIECHLFVESPVKRLLGKMSGIIVSSVLIALALCFSFVYLLRTIIRMKTIGQMRRDFTHNITHELKTPIAAVGAINEALSDFSVGEDPARRGKYLEIQRHYLQSLSSMVDRILSLSIQENERFRMCPEICLVKEIVAEQVRTLPLRYQKTIHVETSFEEEDLRIRVDWFHFSNVLMNILDNAVKYCDTTPHILVKVYRSGNWACVSIRDNGIGIPITQRKHIFEKYYRVSTGDIQNARGFGIGLYYCRLVLEKLGGHISVSDAPGGGSVFVIKIQSV